TRKSAQPLRRYEAVKKKRSALRLVDTTFRDANQSLLSGSLTGDEIVPVAAMMDDIGFTAMEAFGGATFETQIRRGEDPWQYVRELAKATPNKIGRASCRERVEVSVVGGSLKKKERERKARGEEIA